jgi:hypothetical protein
MIRLQIKHLTKLTISEKLSPARFSLSFAANCGLGQSWSTVQLMLLEIILLNFIESTTENEFSDLIIWDSWIWLKWFQIFSHCEPGGGRITNLHFITQQQSRNTMIYTVWFFGDCTTPSLHNIIPAQLYNPAVRVSLLYPSARTRIGRLTCSHGPFLSKDSHHMSRFVTVTDWSWFVRARFEFSHDLKVARGSYRAFIVHVCSRFLHSTRAWLLAHLHLKLPSINVLVLIEI